MKTLKLKKGSWHYRLAGITANLEIFNEPDICSYTRSVLAGILVILLLGMLIAFAGFFLSHMILGAIFASIYGVWILTDIAVIGYIAASLLATVFAIEQIIKFSERRSRRRRNMPVETKPDGFVKHAYKSWKNRFCVKVTFKEEHDDNIRAGQ